MNFSRNFLISRTNHLKRTPFVANLSRDRTITRSSNYRRLRCFPRSLLVQGRREAFVARTHTVVIARTLDQTFSILRDAGGRREKWLRSTRLRFWSKSVKLFRGARNFSRITARICFFPTETISYVPRYRESPLFFLLIPSPSPAHYCSVWHSLNFSRDREPGWISIKCARDSSGCAARRAARKSIRVTSFPVWPKTRVLSRRSTLAVSGRDIKFPSRNFYRSLWSFSFTENALEKIESALSAIIILYYYIIVINNYYN